MKTEFKICLFCISSSVEFEVEFRFFCSSGSNISRHLAALL
uniref:Cullin 4B n=1 Tax=Macaca fascicularis TaxID=9541 RepID=I7GC74_MACFA|nr:unnamed protein product [Macaca fascicularis]